MKTRAFLALMVLLIPSIVRGENINRVTGATKVELDGASPTTPKDGTRVGKSNLLSGVDRGYPSQCLFDDELENDPLEDSAVFCKSDKDGRIHIRQYRAIMPASILMHFNAVANANGATLDVDGEATAILKVLSRIAMSGGTTINFEASLANNIGTGTFGAGSTTTITGVGTLWLTELHVGSEITSEDGQIRTVATIVSNTSITVNTPFSPTIFSTTFTFADWVPIAAHQVGSTNASTTTTTSDGDYRINVAAYKNIRARISAYSAGNITIRGYTTPLAGQPNSVAISNIPHIIIDSSGLPSGASTETTLAAVKTAVEALNTKIPSTVSSATENQVSCTTTTGTLKASNSSRIKIVYLNVSTTTVFVCHTATCTTTTGGKRLKEDMGYEESSYTGALSCITASGTATVAYTEE